MAQASTLATLLIRLGFDLTGLRGQGASAKAEMAGVGTAAEATAGKVEAIGAAAQAAAAQTAASMKLIKNAMRDPTSGRFVSPTQFANPAFQEAENKQNAALAANVMAKQKAAGASTQLAAADKGVATAATTATGGIGGMNTALGMTKLLLGSFAILAFVGFLTDATKAASEFQSEMLLVRTQARASLGEVDAMTESLMKMAPAVRTGPEELAKGLYHVESVGLRGADALKVLTAAAQGARVGNANLEDVTNALVASVTSGIKGVNSMSEAMGVLDGIVGSGNMRMEQLSKSLASGVLATAKAFGLTIQDVGAALAAMTDQGIPAEEAATRLRITITLLGAPTATAAKQLARIGLSSRDLADEMRSPDGIIGALTMLREHLQRSGLDATEQAALLKAAFGGSRSSSGLLTLVGSVDLLNTKMTTIKQAQQDFGEVFALQGQTAAAKMDQLKAIVDVLAISLGNALLPVLIMIANVLGIVFSQTWILVPALSALSAIFLLIATKVLGSFILGMIHAGVEMVISAAAALGLTSASIALAASEVAAAFATGGLSAAMAALVTIMSPILIVVALVAVAFILLVTHADQVAQGIRVLEYVFLGLLKTVADVLGQIPFLGDGFHDLSKQLQGDIDSLMHEMKAAQEMIDAKGQGFDISKINFTNDPAKALSDSLKDSMPELEETEKSLVEQFGYTMEGVKKAAATAGADAMSEMADAIQKHADAPADALVKLHDMLRKALDPSVEIARLYGELQSTELAAGMASKNPAVFAQAVATTKLIEDRLDELTNHAYSAGKDAATDLLMGFNRTMIDMAPHFDKNGKELFGPFLITSKEAKARADALVPSVGAVTNAMAGLNEEMHKSAMSEGLQELKAAFSEISTAAHAYFDKLHNDTMKAIDDQLAHKNAILDAKKALNQAPVTAAQKALDFQRDQIQEFRLREAIAKANGPEAYRDAVLALQDFLAQQHINQMQDEVDAANASLDNQKAANDRAAEAKKAAETARYEEQKKNFDRDLALLQDYLSKHPGEWSKTEEKVLKLLRGYGISYKKAGLSLGGEFVEGLKTQLAAAEAAVKKMADLIPQAFGASGFTPSPNETGITNFFNTGGGGSGWPTNGMGANYIGPRATGDWRILKDNVFAMLHQDEMIAPADASGLLRQLGSKRISSGMAQVGGGGGRLVVQIGEEKIADIIDSRMSIQDDIYGRGGMQVSTGSQR